MHGSKNMFDPKEEQGDSWDKEIEEDVVGGFKVRKGQALFCRQDFDGFCLLDVRVKICRSSLWT